MLGLKFSLTLNLKETIAALVVTSFVLNATAQTTIEIVQKGNDKETVTQAPTKPEPSKEPKVTSIQINVDANSKIDSINVNSVDELSKTGSSNSNISTTTNINANSNNNTSTQTEDNSNKVEIKDNAGSSIGSEITNPTNPAAKAAVQQNVSNPQVTPSVVPQGSPIQDSKVLSPVINQAPAKIVEEVKIVKPLDPVIQHPVHEATTLPAHPHQPIVSDDFTEIAKDVVKAKIVDTILNRYYVRGTYGFSDYTSIEDITSNYSLGIAFGYNLRPNYSIEFQYIFTEYEDTYNYNYYESLNTSGYIVDQNDYSLIFNFKLMNRIDYNFFLRGGFTYSYRTSYNWISGFTNSANAFGAVFGLGGDIRVARNLFITGILDYNLNLSTSGYDYYTSPLYLVNGENFISFNFGLTYQF